MRISKKWIPSIAVPAVIAAGAVAVPLQANAVDLPDLSANEVMVLMQQSEVQSFSGTIVKVSDMGLPTLEFSSMVSEEMVAEMEEKMPEEFADFVPAVIESNILTQAVELISGTHRIRVYNSGADKLRAQILDPMSQRDLIVNGDQFWIYDAKMATAVNGTIEMEQDPAKQAEAEKAITDYAASVALDLTSPEAIADYLVSMIGDSSNLSVGTDHSVAGRTAYELILTPNVDGSLVERAKLSIDSETGMPLKVEVFSASQVDAAMSVGFESISFGAIDQSLFDFTPPAGTEVSSLDSSDYEAGDKDSADYAEKTEPEILGENWLSVVHLAAMPTEIPADLMSNELFGDMFTEVQGGRVLTSALVNVLITDSGDVYMGAVTIDYLLSVAN
jgi:outer membrane lipoprotein-sorting protein